MRLFDEQIRSYLRAPEYGEATFAFLNRSISPQEGAIRERLESWFLRYPESNARNLRERLRSEDGQQHNAAFFELLLHEFLLRFGCRVEVEAGGSSRTTKPDFLVEDPCGLKWYLEAVTVSAKPSPTREAQQIVNSLCDWLNERLPRRDFLLFVSYTGNPSGSLPRKRVLKFLLDKLGSCDYSTVLGVSRTRGHAALPSWEYPWGACRIRFQLVPRKESAREDARVRVLGYPNLARETLFGTDGGSNEACDLREGGEVRQARGALCSRPKRSRLVGSRGRHHAGTVWLGRCCLWVLCGSRPDEARDASA